MSTSIEAGRLFIAVPFEDKDRAKRLGARWDAEARSWFVPAGLDRGPFAAWVPEQAGARSPEQDPHAAFAQALRDAGLKIEGSPAMDGHIHRVQAEGDSRWKRSGSYIGHLDGKPAGYIKNFRTGLETRWKIDGQDISPAERDRLNAVAAQKRHDRTIERAAEHERAAEKAADLWAGAAPATSHPYLGAKQVPSFGLRQAATGQTVTIERDGEPAELDIGGRLLVPVSDRAGRLQSLQIIRADGAKMFLPGGRVEGGHFVVGDVNQPGPLFICEGYATAAEVRGLAGAPVVVAFDAGNLLSVARACRERCPARPIFIAGDNDHRREAEEKPNVGRIKAEEAAAAIGGVALIPQFAPHERGSDWNDLARLHGRKDARTRLLTAVAIAERESAVARRAASRGREAARSEPDRAAALER